MKLHFTRSFILARLQTRIEVLEKRHKEAIVREAKLREMEKVAEGPEYNEFSGRRLVTPHPPSSAYAEALVNVRFVIEHLPGTPTIECDFAHALLFGVVDPESAIGFGF